MRDLTHHDGDSVPGALGPPIRPQPKAREPEQVAPGIWRDPDGKLRTDRPLPPAAPTIYNGG